MPLEKLIQSIEPIIALSEGEKQQMAAFFETKQVGKNEYFLKEGTVCNSIAFVNKGVLIYYMLTDDGKEMTTDFAFEGDWACDNRSRLNHSKSFINIKAIEDAELFVISAETLEHSYRCIPKLERLGRILIEQAFVKITRQSIDLQTLTAHQRYDKLLEEYPEIFQKVPLYHIANYLGIAPKSLSRIRKK